MQASHKPALSKQPNIKTGNFHAQISGQFSDFTWNKGQALLYNFLSALTFLIGGIVAYSASLTLDVTFLLPFAAGNFIYIAAADLIPEIKHEENAGLNLIHFLSFLAGLALLLLVRIAFEE